MARPQFALFALTALFVAPERAFCDQGPSAEVRRAERTLRSAELRETDDVAMAMYRRASREAEAALARNPDSATANFVYFAATGRILLAGGLTRNLLALRSLDRDYLDRALALDPEHPHALAAKGGILLDLPVLLGGDPVEALRLLRRASRLNPGGPGTRVTLARALARTGRPLAARREARLAAHHACRRGHLKPLEAASTLLEELEPAVARATTP